MYSQIHESQEHTLNQTKMQKDVDLRQQGIELKQKDNTISRMKEKRHTDAKQNEEPGTRDKTKDQKVERLNRLLDDPKSEQCHALSVSEKQVLMENNQKFNCLII